MSCFQDDPIAIVGMSFRLPTEATTDDAFWQMLVDGRCASGDVPNDRFSLKKTLHPSADRIGTSLTDKAHFIHRDVACFDAPFFQMTSAEAAATDPQHRFLLEASYEALEDAGIPLKSVVGSNTGCYIGAFGSEYFHILTKDPVEGNKYAALGIGGAMLSNRLSWFFDFKGPSFSLDTACSSSMVALHLACQSLKSGESSMALVGGVALMLDNSFFMALSRLRMVSPDGVCHTFDERANGYARGEGVGILVLKRLSDAIKNNDTIRAVIRGTAINQDGKTPSITVPSPTAQAELIRETYAKAGLDFAQTGYFEAHGTGTPQGDFMEMTAIADVFSHRGPKNPLYVGSVKTNVGHGEGLAGINGLIKSVLMLERGGIPPLAGFEKLNPRLKIDEWNIKLPLGHTPWPKEGVRRISINSFGYGGTNSHAILDDAFHYLKDHNLNANHITVDTSACHKGARLLEDVTISSTEDVWPQTLVFSAPEQSGLQRLNKVYREAIEPKSGSKTADQKPVMADNFANSSLTDIAYTLAARRTAFEWRTFLVANELQGLSECFEVDFPKFKRSKTKPGCAFIFTGQGAQWPAMGRELLRHPVFEAALTKADQHLASLGCSWRVVEELVRPKQTSKLNGPAFSQPICTIVQIALVDLLASWNVFPTAVVGHSSGEIGAAYAMQALSFEDACTVAYFRGILSASIPNTRSDLQGAMLVTSLSKEQAEEMVSSVTCGRACIACVNSSNSVTISGDETAIDYIEKLLTTKRLFARRLRVDVAYHSHHMEAIADQYLDSLQGIRPLKSKSGVTMFSSVTGDRISGEQLGPEYWVKNMVSMVNFAEAIATLLRALHTKGRRQKMNSDVTIMVEVGPHSALQGPVRQIMLDHGRDHETIIPYTSVLQRNMAADQTAVQAAATVWTTGVDVDIERMNSGGMSRTPKVVHILPSYPWNHSHRHWHEGRKSKNLRLDGPPRTDMLGLRTIDSSTNEPSWYNILQPTEFPWIFDHKMQGTVLLPAACMMAMAIEAAQQFSDKSKKLSSIELTDVSFNQALIFHSDDALVETRFSLRPYKPGSGSLESKLLQFHFQTFNGDQKAIEHSSGVIELNYEEAAGFDEEQRELEHDWKSISAKAKAEIDKCSKILDKETLYNKLRKCGLEFGPTFMNLSNVRCRPGVSIMSITVPDTAAVMPSNYEYPHVIHPVVLDSFLQSIAPGFIAMHDSTVAGFVPHRLKRLWINMRTPKLTPGDVLDTHAISRKQGFKEHVGDVVVGRDSWSKPLAILDEFVAVRFNGADTSDAKVSTVVTRSEWIEDVRFAGQNDATRIREICKQLSSSEGTESFHAVAKQISAHDIVAAGVSTWLQRSGDANPAQKVLHFANKSTGLIEKNIEILQGSKREPTRVSSYVVCSARDTNITLEQSLQSVPFVSLKEFDTVSGQPEGDTEETKYDVVVWEADECEKQQANSLAAHFRSLLQPHGKIVVSTMTNSCSNLSALDTAQPTKHFNMTQAEWEGLLRANGFGDCELVLPGTEAQPLSMMISSVAQSVGARETEHEITILVPQEPSEKVQDMVRYIQAAISTHNGNANVQSFDDNFDAHSKFIISLVDLDPQRSILFNVDPKQYENIKALCLNCTGMVWLTQADITRSMSNPFVGMFTGLARTVVSEQPHLRICHLDLAPDCNDNMTKSVDAVLQVLYSVATSQEERIDLEYAEVNGVVYIPRIQINKDMSQNMDNRDKASVISKGRLNTPGRRLALTVGQPGLLDTLHFNDVEALGHVKPVGPYHIEIAVDATGLNFMDILTANGSLPITVFGHEAAGRVLRVGSKVTKHKVGDFVYGMFAVSFGNIAVTDEEQAHPVPIGMTAEEAAALPIVYFTAYLCLIEGARLRKGEKILIHAGAGGLGQACISIAKEIGAEIFTTVSSNEKRDVLINRYGIAADHIFNSRTLTFARGVRRMTNGEGVDVVVNSLSGEGLRQSFKCVAEMGRFVEVGKRDAYNNTRLEMSTFVKHVSFHLVNLEIVDVLWARHRYVDLCRRVFAFMDRGIHKPAYPLNVYSTEQIEQAFRSMQSGKHIGKIVVKAGANDIVPLVAQDLHPMVVRSDVTYMLVGGLGGIGRSIANLLVTNGARNLVFVSRSAGDAKYRVYLDSLKAQGVRAQVYACDISKEAEVQKTMVECSRDMPPLKGLIQCAMVLRDGIFENMSYDDWTVCTSPKVNGTWNLHCHTPRDLDFFIMLSSVSGVMGNTGQANYSAGNVFLDNLAFHRRAMGLKATSLALGAVVDVGYLAVDAFTDKARAEMLAAGYNTKVLSKSDGLGVLEVDIHDMIKAAVTGYINNETTTPPQFITGVGIGLNGIFEKDPRICLMMALDTTGRSGGSGSANKDEFSDAALAAATNLEDANKIVEKALVARVAIAISMSFEDIDVELPLYTYGVDSLTAVEVRNWTSSKLKSDISIFDILSSLPIKDLATKITLGSSLVKTDSLKQERDDEPKQRTPAAANSRKVESRVRSKVTVETIRGEKTTSVVTVAVHSESRTTESIPPPPPYTAMAA